MFTLVIRNSKASPSSSSSSSIVRGTSAACDSTDVEEKKVQDILQNSELRDMLMDVKMQNIIKDCGDPIKFRQYMSNPDIAKKLKKLFDAGLIGTVS